MAPSTALLGWAGSTFELVLLRLVQGVAAAAIAAPTFALAGDLSRRRRGPANEPRYGGVQPGNRGRPAAGRRLGGRVVPPAVRHRRALSLVAAAVVFYLVPETVRRRR